MAKVLGLDLGSYSVKGVLIESTLRGGGQVKAYGEVRRTEGERTASLRDALAELLARFPLATEQVVVALPAPSLATHTLTLPFVDAKRIDATLAFEVEGQLPFDLAEVVFDYQVAAQKDNRSDLLVGVVRKEDLRALLDLLGALKLDPRVVSHPAIACHSLLAGLSLATPLPEEEAVAIVDVGHERVSVAIGGPATGVEFGRTFPGGGWELTRALATEFQISLDEAQAWKEAHGALASGVHGEDAARAARAMQRALAPLLRELRATFKAYTARSRRTVSRLYLCGGTSRLPGLDEQLAEDLALPCERLPPPEAAAVTLDQTWPTTAQAFSLALRGQATGPRAPRFNLRRGEFAFKGHFDYLRERVALLASFGVTLLILLIASGLVHNSLLARRERQVDALLCQVTERVLGQCEKNYDRALNMLRGKESPATAIPRLSAVSLLAVLVERTPADVSVKFDQIVVDTERITVRGETDSSKQVDRLTSALKSYRCFQEIKQGKVEKAKGGQKMSFNLDIQVECPGEGAL